MEHQFTDDTLRLATYKLAVENNSILRIMLNNQVLIMKKLGIEFNEKSVAPPFPSLISESPLDENAEYRVFLEAGEMIEKAVTERSWNWAVDNDSSLDSDDLFS
ncbi:hypothetical protein [Chitinophaga sancti]|uniref:Uncharacterized protein n=1 Tax=Chitinophaga sancti TaxID=1004 RepID=A0A1K1M143_9BACT|nr:hypothetical protein [Chitinophaga sancti]WQD64711.1 hypothetical protein U0033_09915 [Chitinophaga sancti]WQG89667.1 hypothetical protein SR876_32560 [Chitinophaga sancti]SFW16833.1 hypothetical protein SAMN05661012_00362 [Chitinophaga sancti]